MWNSREANKPIRNRIAEGRIAKPAALVGAATKSHEWIEVTPRRLLDLFVTPTQNGGLLVGVSFEL